MPIDAGLCIRAMTLDDIDRVQVIEQASQSHPWSGRIFQDCVQGAYLCRVLCDEREPQVVIGFIVFSVAVGECHLLNICVDPPLRGSGYGSTLIASMLDEAAPLGAELCLLEVRAGNAAAMGLYEKLGFVQVGRRKAYYPGESGREDALLYTLEMPLVRV